MSGLVTLALHDCEVHLEHRPRIDRAGGKFTVEKHHIHPLGFDGPDTPDNWIYICPTGHTAVHELLRIWVKTEAKPPWEIARYYHPAERHLAEEGFVRIKAAGLVAYAQVVLRAEAAALST